jgi:hypothetical protein
MTDTPTAKRPTTADAALRKIHRVSAILFLISTIPAGFASFQGGEPSPVVYIPLVFLLGLALTGCYQLVAPWLRRRRLSATSRA